MVMRVRKDRERDYWGGFCSVTSGGDDRECDEDSVKKAGSAKGSKALSNEEIQSIVKSYDRDEIIRRIPPVKAPFFGPARKLGEFLVINFSAISFQFNACSFRFKFAPRRSREICKTVYDFDGVL